MGWNGGDGLGRGQWLVTVPTWGRLTTMTMTCGRSVVLGGANAQIEDTDAVVVRSSRYVNGAEEVRVPFLQRGGGGVVASLLSAAEAHAAKGNVGDKESEEDNDWSSSSGGGKR